MRQFLAVQLLGWAGRTIDLILVFALNINIKNYIKYYSNNSVDIPLLIIIEIYYLSITCQLLLKYLLEE